MLSSKLFFGSVFHRRHVEKAHSFRYRLFMLYLDLDELPEIAKKFPFFGIERAGPLSFWRKDYLPKQSHLSLKEAVVETVRQETAQDFAGKVFILTHPRWFGFIMNPLTLYYCFDNNSRLRHVVGEITNTPWGERHSYVMTLKEGESPTQSFVFTKGFHVSPFLPMGMEYTWKISTPGTFASVQILNRVEGRLDFEAHLGLKAKPLTTWNLFRLWILDPWITVKVAAGIYWNAGILFFIKRVRFYDHQRVSETKEATHV